MNTVLQSALQEYENENPNIVIEKDKTISDNDLEWGEQYILLFINTDNEDPPKSFDSGSVVSGINSNNYAHNGLRCSPDINQVVYQGKQEEKGVFRLDSENPDCVIRKEGVMSHFFRTDSKPRRFYNVLSTDIDVNCFFYKMTTH